jgi:hypothetical protein
LRVITVVKGWEGGRREEGTLEGWSMSDKLQLD